MDHQPQLHYTSPAANNNEAQRPLRILSLDGGGVRGYSMLLLLQEVMLKLFVEMEGRAPKRWEIPRPCDHFDLIAGTGTGGLIAIILGRLRLDVDTALDIYVDMTRRVFETNKTVGGVPYRKTLYKASKLEEAIKEVVSMYESPETTDPRRKVSQMGSPYMKSPGLFGWGARQSSPALARQKRSLTLPGGRSGVASPMPSTVGGNDTGPAWTPQIRDVFAGEEALWYDERAGKCKTFVTAVYHGSSTDSQPALLRTYDSAVESSPSAGCRIWEAGRATCATYPAFKAIQVGQSLFHDEGHGRFNPSLVALEEAIENEWPGRKVGVFISIGSGKLPTQACTNNLEPPPAAPRGGVRGSIIGATPLQKFVDAKENHILKIGDCEQIHLETVQEFRRRGLDEEGYFRLNVDSSARVGQAGMAEWSRLVDISNGTRAYLARPEVQRCNAHAAKRLARIWRQEGNLGMAQLNCVGSPIPDRAVDATANTVGAADGETRGITPWLPQTHINKSLPELPPPTRRSSPSQPISEAAEPQVALPIIPHLATEFSDVHPIQTDFTARSHPAVPQMPGTVGVNIIRRRVPPPHVHSPPPSLPVPAPAYAQNPPSYEPTSARIVDVSVRDTFEMFRDSQEIRNPDGSPFQYDGEYGLGIVDTSQQHAQQQEQSLEPQQQQQQQQQPQYVQQNDVNNYQSNHYVHPYQQQYQRYINPNTTVPAHRKYVPYQPGAAGASPATPTTYTALPNLASTPSTIPFSPALPTPPLSTTTTPVINNTYNDDPTLASLDRYLAQSLARQRREGDGEVSGDEDFDKPITRGRHVSVNSTPSVNRRMSMVSSIYSNGASERPFEYDTSTQYYQRDIRA